MGWTLNFCSLFPFCSFSTMTSFPGILFYYILFLCFFSKYWMVSLFFHSFQVYIHWLFFFPPCGNTRSWSWHQICDTSFFLFILKFYGLVKMLIFHMYGFECLKLVVSTSSVVWSQVRWFFILEYIFPLLTMVKEWSHLGYLLCLLSLLLWSNVV